VNVVRAFDDGDFVFGHTEYDFATRRIGFEVFCFEDGQAVEHWDNIQARLGPNESGRSMVDGPTEATDHDLTENNRAFVRSFFETVLVGGQLDRLAAPHAEHRQIDYQRVHRVLAEGNFVLSVSEGAFGGVHSACYDLFRVADEKLVEHWDTTEKIAPRSEWKNDNGKF